MTRSPTGGLKPARDLREQQHLFGGVAERLKVLVLKTSVGETPPWVRILTPSATCAAVAQMAEQPLCKRTRAGSMPAGGTIILARAAARLLAP